MKTTTNSKSTNNSITNPKSKKTTRDREKRKSQTSDKTDTDKGSPTKDGSSRKYAGIGPESILTYSEQSSVEHLSEDLCYGLAEDISYKLRHIINDALIKARLSGRNHLLSTDIDATFENLSIDKVYGATSNPNWVPFGEGQTYYYLDDTIVDLIELAEEENNYIQPSDTVVTRKWFPKEIGPSLKNYFDTICLAIVSNETEVQKAALADIRVNNFIGPIVDWFYNFGYILLSKDITYDSLTLCALDLIRALEGNPIAAQIVSEKHVKLLVRLILQRLLRSVTTVEVLKPMCNILSVLCDRPPIMELVVLKIAQKMPEMKESFSLPLITVINELGKEVVLQLLVPRLDHFLKQIRNSEPNLTNQLLRTYRILADLPNLNTDKKFYEYFGDALIPMRKDLQSSTTQRKVDPDWLKLKPRFPSISYRKVHQPVQRSKKPMSFREAFPEAEVSSTPAKIRFKFRSFEPKKRQSEKQKSGKKRTDFVLLGKKSNEY